MPGVTSRERVLVFDGAMGTSIQGYDLTADGLRRRALEGCNDYLVITRPDVIEEIHASFLEAGCDVVETDTFRSNRITLGEYGLGDRVREINVAAARLARAPRTASPRRSGRASSPAPSAPRASSPPPPTRRSATSPSTSWSRSSPSRRARWSRAGGRAADRDLAGHPGGEGGDLRLPRGDRAAGRPVALQVQVTLDTSGRMLLGTDIGAALVTLESLRVDVIGLNCSTGPEHMRSRCASSARTRGCRSR
jgi:5-methyltetrahydrofolate--homocysteine methyltransferase